jgi:hypothetical protein
MKRKLSKIKLAKKKFWKRGEIARVSAISGIRISAISGILHRQLGVSPGRALILAGAVKEVTGKNVPVMDFIFNKNSKHPIFF